MIADELFSKYGLLIVTNMQNINILKQLFVAVVLIVAGLLSRSNCFGGRASKIGPDILSIVLAASFLAVAVYFIWSAIELRKGATKANRNETL